MRKTASPTLSGLPGLAVDFTAPVTRQLSRNSAAFLELASERLAAQSQLIRQLSSCENPTEIIQRQSDFMRGSMAAWGNFFQNCWDGYVASVESTTTSAQTTDKVNKTAA